MARKSTVHRLPPALKQKLDELLSDGGYTLDEILAHLNQLGATVSRSALGRYSKNFAAVRERLAKAREMAAAFAQDIGTVGEGQLGRTIAELMQSLIFDLLMARADVAEGGSLDAEEIMFLSKSIKDLQAAMKASIDAQLKIREEERKKAVNEAAAAAEKTAKAAGLSRDTIEAIKAGILGIAS